MLIAVRTTAGSLKIDPLTSTAFLLCCFYIPVITAEKITFVPILELLKKKYLPVRDITACAQVAGDVF